MELASRPCGRFTFWQGELNSTHRSTPVQKAALASRQPSVTPTPKISILSHAANRPVADIAGFRSSFTNSHQQPFEIVIVEDRVWDKCAMVNAAAAEAKGDWYFVSDIDNRFGIDIVQRLSAFCTPDYDAIFFRNVQEIKDGQPVSGAEGESKSKWAYTASLISSSLWKSVGGFDPRFKKWGWMDLDFYQACRAVGTVLEDTTVPVLSLWHPTWKLWHYSKFGEPQCYIDRVMLDKDMWLYRMTIPSSQPIIDIWKNGASPFLLDVFTCWTNNRFIYEAKWPAERERIRTKYLTQLGVDTY
jgi:hypothetical protein